MEKSAQKNILRRLAINTPFLHQLSNIKDLFEVVANEKSLLPSIIEKDYWLMHCLWGIKQQGYKFELKGGTSLSKGFNIIERFSEDIDIQLHPNDKSLKVGKNHDKASHILARSQFFDKTSNELQILGFIFERDYTFDDPSEKMRSAGIKGVYNSCFASHSNLKEGIILELGFDQTTPYIEKNITSWAFEKAKELNLNIIDNRATNVPCYCPEYTFVEKLQTVSTKYRLQQERTIMPINFLRHYYDIYKLLENERVLKFIGTNEYISHKESRFRGQDEPIIKKNSAFTMENAKIRKLYNDEFIKKSSIYFGRQPTFEEILERIKMHVDLL